jgi:hypothetical protein
MALMWHEIAGRHGATAGWFCNDDWLRDHPVCGVRKSHPYASLNSHLLEAGHERNVCTKRSSAFVAIFPAIFCSSDNNRHRGIHARHHNALDLFDGRTGWKKFTCLRAGCAKECQMHRRCGTRHPVDPSRPIVDDLAIWSRNSSLDQLSGVHIVDAHGCGAVARGN